MQDAWVPCKLYIKMQDQKPRRAYVILQDADSLLEPRAGVVLLIRHPSGVVFQVLGKVSRRRGRGSVEVYISIDAALSLAAQIGANVEKNTTIYGYTAMIKNIKPPPA